MNLTTNPNHQTARRISSRRFLAFITCALALGSVAVEARPPFGAPPPGGGGRVAVAGPRGVAVAGPRGVAVASRPAPRPPMVAPRPAPRPPVVVVPPPPRPPVGAVIATAAIVAATAPPPPVVYVTTVPPGYKVVPHNGHTCFFVGGVHYCPEFQGGETVYVVVKK